MKPGKRLPDGGVGAILAPTALAQDIAKRVVLVLYAYLDDSGTHDSSPTVVLGGYVAQEAQWRAFERAARSLGHALLDDFKRPS
jgi:hypothetical protein